MSACTGEVWKWGTVSNLGKQPGEESIKTGWPYHKGHRFGVPFDSWNPSFPRVESQLRMIFCGIGISINFT